MITGNLESQSSFKGKKQNSYMQKELLNQQYKKIHVWDFPPTTTIRIEKKFRKELIRKFINHIGSWTRAIDFINKQSRAYGFERKYSNGAFHHWIVGKEKKKVRNIPLWVAVEISKVLSKNENRDNKYMRLIEEKLEYCATGGRGIHVKMKFPLFLTPEMVSIAFHLYGDGFLGEKGKMSSYRQVNKRGLENFTLKLKNSFGDFSSKNLEESKIIIPRVISQFYEVYFALGDCRWDVARVNKEIKNLPNPFLLAGLTSFIIDEGSIGGTIEIYSSNKKLLEDIGEIIIKLGYICYGPRKKSKDESSGYRVYISLNSASQFYEDIKGLQKIFPTCDLAHKQTLLEDIIRRQRRPWKKYKNGVMKQKIIELLSIRNLNTKQIIRKLNTGHSTLLRHLRELEKQNKIKRVKKHKECCLLWNKIG